MSLLRLLYVLVSGVVLAGCATAAPRAAQPEPALDRLRERMAERQGVRGVGASENEPEELATSGLADGPGFAYEAPSMLLEPRYGGALPDTDPLVLGVYNLRTHRDPIVDGDTVAVIGLDASLRLTAIDTEEVWHHRSDLRDRAYSDFGDYLRLMYADAQGIPKFATPMGELAREYARQFFEGDTRVRLEYDSLENTRGYFGRYLVYVYAERDEGWVNYNLECVRAGMSPYFTKYGYSRRFHDELVEAQNEARAEQRGIWDPVLPHYPDYDERLAWWDRRAEAIEHFRRSYGGRPDYVEVGRTSEFERLVDLAGRTITVFGTIADIREDWTPPRVLLSHRIGNDFIMVAFRDGVLSSYDFERYRGEYFYVRGRVNLYRGSPQFILDDGVEIWMEP
jgi:endonuclease YncB( thermonuclease family)